VEHEPRRAARRRSPVGVVAEDGQAGAREMDPDLVLAAGPRPRLHHQSARERFHEPEIGHRGAAPRPRRAVRVGVHARLRTPGGRRKAGRTGREGDVGLRHLARGELRRQRRIHRGVLREEHHAGGVAVEALMDAEVRERVPRALAAGEQALDQPDQVRTARIRRRHRGEAGRLVDGDEAGVLEQDARWIERGRPGGRHETAAADRRLEASAGLDGHRRRPRGPAVHTQRARHDEPAHRRSRRGRRQGRAQPFHGHVS